MKVIEIIIRI